MSTKNIYDLIIVGSGPAGLSAGIYAARHRLNTLLLEGLAVGGQALITDWIENYPGFPSGIKGGELIEQFRLQAEKFGLKTSLEEVKAIKPISKGLEFSVTTTKNSYNSKSVVIASGASQKRLGISKEDDFIGKGISYCATCDGPLFKDKDILVVGGGDTAAQEAMYLTRFARKVTLIHRRDRLRATKILQERLLKNPKIEVLWSSKIKQILGKQRLEGAVVVDTKNDKEKRLSCQGIFIFVGLMPNTGFLKGVVDLDKEGYVITDNNMQTSYKGIFACGDCRSKHLRQVVTAAGEGAQAVHSAYQYIEELKGTLYK